MSGARWVAAGAFWMSFAVLLGAFGAHALEARLVAAGQLDAYETAVRYHAWHALGLIALGLCGERRVAPAAGWMLLAGSALFSGSIYALALGGPSGLLGPLTPLGGGLLLGGWVAFGASAWRNASRA